MSFLPPRRAASPCTGVNGGLGSLSNWIACSKASIRRFPNGLFHFIPRSRFFKLSGSFLADLYVQNQLPNLARALTKTSSTSRSWAVPASISLILRHISISQALATSSSFGPPKLATNALANFALSLSDRAIAAFFSASKSAALILGSNTVVISRIMHQTIAHNKSLNPTPESKQVLLRNPGGAGQFNR